MDWWLHHEWKMEHPLVWELREILLMPNRNWNGSMKNKSRWKFSKCRMLLSVDTFFFKKKKNLTLGSLLRWNSLHWSDHLEECQTSIFYDMDKGWDCTAETPTWDSEFQSEKLIFRAFSRWKQIPLHSQPGWWKRAAFLCHKACTPLSGCAQSMKHMLSWNNGILWSLVLWKAIFSQSCQRGHQQMTSSWD